MQDSEIRCTFASPNKNNMEKSKTYEHMTESDKVVYDLLFDKLNNVYAENKVALEKLNDSLVYYIMGLLDVPDTHNITVNHNGYSTNIRIKEKDNKGWGRELSIYTKEKHDYLKNEVKIEGIEVSMSSMRFSSVKFDTDEYVYLMLCAEIAKHIDEVQAQIVRAYHQYHDMSKKTSAIEFPMQKLVNETDKRVKEDKRKKVISAIYDGATIEYQGKYNGRERIEHVFIHKINKKTAHVTFFHNGWRQEEAMRFNLDELIEKISSYDFKIVDNSEIKKLRESVS